ncbi:MAG: hypothetical protein ACRDMJ_01135 [Solirubrobacteraceae bacterium]
MTASGLAIACVMSLFGTRSSEAGALAAGGRSQHRDALAANRHAARADASALLAAVPLPPGSTPASAEPSGDAGWLRPELSLMATPARATVHGWWLIPGGSAATIAWVRAHPPAGSHVTGSGSGSKPGSSMQEVDFDWPPVPGVLNWRELQVTVTVLGGDRTGLLAQAQSDWVVPRRAGERVPAGVRVVDVASGPLDGPPTQVLDVMKRRRIGRLVSLLNSLPTAQPGTYSCPGMALAGARELTLTFRARPGGAALARAYYADYPPLEAASGPCNSVQFWVRGRQETALIGGDIVHRLQRILGAHLV